MKALIWRIKHKWYHWRGNKTGDYSRDNRQILELHEKRKGGVAAAD